MFSLLIEISKLLNHMPGVSDKIPRISESRNSPDKHQNLEKNIEELSRKLKTRVLFLSEG
jgi:hypothetical protein